MILSPAMRGFLKPAGGPSSSLLFNLISYYKMDEASGTRADSTTNWPLTAVNNPGSAAGIIGNGVNCTTAGMGLTSGIPNTTQPKITLSVWVKRNSLTAFNQIGWFDTTNRLFGFNFLNDGQLLCHCEGGSAVSGAIADAFTTLRHYVMVYDGTIGVVANRIKLYRNGVLAAGLSVSGAVPSSYLASGVLRIPRNGVADGLLDEVGLWVDALTQTQITALYNAGAGVTWPFTGVP